MLGIAAWAPRAATWAKTAAEAAASAPAIGLLVQGRALCAADCPTHRPRRESWWSARHDSGRGLRHRRGFFSAASCQLPAACACAPHHCRIEHYPVQIGFLHGLEQALPNSLLAQRRLRLRSVSCLPKRASSVRQAQPWRATQNAALRKSRLSSRLLTNAKIIVRTSVGQPFHLLGLRTGPTGCWHPH